MIETEDRLFDSVDRQLVPDVLWVLGTPNSFDELLRPSSSGPASDSTVVGCDEQGLGTLPLRSAAPEIGRDVRASGPQYDCWPDFAALDEVGFAFPERKRGDRECAYRRRRIADAECLQDETRPDVTRRVVATPLRDQAMWLQSG